MTTSNKDFKVKNGLVVTNGGFFGDSVVVGTPFEDNHAATKLYVDENSGTFYNIDGGKPDTNYTGIAPIDAGGV